MKSNQLTRGSSRRIMYIENKDGDIDGVTARIGWVTFSKTGLSVQYRNRTFKRAKGAGIRGNYYDEESGDEYWISGIKSRGSNGHWAGSVGIEIDDDAQQEYLRLRSQEA